MEKALNICWVTLALSIILHFASYLLVAVSETLFVILYFGTFVTGIISVIVWLVLWVIHSRNRDAEARKRWMIQ